MKPSPILLKNRHREASQTVQIAGMNLAWLLHYSQLRVSPTRVCGLGGARMSSTSGLRFFSTGDGTSPGQFQQ